MRLSVGAKVLSYVLDSSKSIICSDINLFIDYQIAWLQSSNHKVVQSSLEILTELVNRMRFDFHPYLGILLPHLVDKLEDSKEVIREKTSVLLLKLVDCDVVPLQNLFDKISPACFSHKNSNVREQIMYLLCTVLDTYGASSLSLSKLVPSIVKLLGDPNASVRSTAFDTLCKIYRHVGERLRSDLLKKNLIPANKQYALLSKFDEIRASEEGINDAFQSLKIHDEDVVDKRELPFDSNSLKKSTSRPPITPASIGLAYSVKSKLSANKATAAAPSGGNNQGGVDEECFEDSFEKVPTMQIYSGRDVDDCLRKCHDVLKNENEDWSKRVDSLKKVRSLIVAGALNYDEFYDQFNTLMPPLHASIKELRSMVVREACITIAYMAKSLEQKFDHFAEAVLNSLINLIQNSKKVIATSGLVCIRFILQYTHAPRLLPIICNNLNSKSKDIRRSCCEFVSLVLQTWHVHSIERYAPALQEAIKKGIVDADGDARLHARKAYTIFAQHFPASAESLKNSLDFSYRKLLSTAGSNSGSSTSLSKYGGGGGGGGSVDVKSSLPRNMCNVSLRSNSAIDLQAVKRAKTRAQYAAMARQRVATTLTAAATPISRTKNASAAASEQRIGRTKSRISVSQPTSRSGSPSSRFSTYSHYLANTGSSVCRSRKSSIGNDTSRETSPNRSFGSPSFGGYKSRLSTQPVRRPVIAQKILQRSLEAESELADALGNIADLSPYSYSPSRTVHRMLDDHSDESETSSMCSEHSFDSYRRPSDSMSWNGSQHRLYREMGDLPLKDIGDIIANCESSHWNERKKGLISLQYYIQDGNKLELYDLKKIMDIFLKIFNDPHIKVFSLFLDTLNELILSHSVDLCFCLHLLLTRLFNKLGTDLLNSVHSKIMKTLDNVFTSFPHDLQIQSVFRFLVDPTQTPNTRVKLAALNYVIKLTSVVDPCAAFTSSNSSGKDYATLALTKIINWAMPDNLKSTPELRKTAQDTVLALFNLNTSQVTRRLSSMPANYQETASAICKNVRSPTSNAHYGADYANNHSALSSLNNSVDMNLSSGSVVQTPAKSAPAAAQHANSFGVDDTGYKSFCHSLSNNVHKTVAAAAAANAVLGESHSSPDGIVRSFDSDTVSSTSPPNDSSAADSAKMAGRGDATSPAVDYGDALKSCVDELAQLNENHQAKKELLLKLMTLVRDSPSNAIITHFKSLLGRIISLMASAEPAPIKELVLNLLQVVVKRKTVTFLLKQFSDLVITKVIALCGDASRDVVKAAENCAIVLSTHLPAESVIRIIVPLITSEAAPVKLVAIKMLTRLVECADDSVTLANIDQIMPVLLIAYDDVESSVRKAAVFCMVALYKQSDQMKSILERYIAKLQGAKLKLVQLYINRAEQGSSMPTSPKNS